MMKNFEEAKFQMVNIQENDNITTNSNSGGGVQLPDVDPTV